MNAFTNNKKTRKFILILVLLILFNFIFPKNIRADEIFGGKTIEDRKDELGYTTSNKDDQGGFFDIGTNFSKLLFLGERAIIRIIK